MPRQDYRSPEAQKYRPWYKTRAWRLCREIQLSKQPLCIHCKDRGIITVATVVNHIKPHKGDWELFISSANHESTCAPCHDGAIQSFERTGIMRGTDTDGRPTDPAHPWNR